MRAIYKYAKITELFEVQAARGDADALTVAAVGIQRKSMRLLYYGVVGVAEAADHSMGWGRAQNALPPCLYIYIFIQILYVYMHTYTHIYLYLHE